MVALMAVWQPTFAAATAGTPAASDFDVLTAGFDITYRIVC
jgi:hypothetical protein